MHQIHSTASLVQLPYGLFKGLFVHWRPFKNWWRLRDILLCKNFMSYDLLSKPPLSLDKAEVNSSQPGWIVFFFRGGQGPSLLLWPVLQAYRDMVSFSRSGTDPAGPTAGSNFYLMWTSRVGFQHQLNIWSSLQAGAGTDGACWLVMLDRLVGARR